MVQELRDGGSFLLNFRFPQRPAEPDADFLVDAKGVYDIEPDVVGRYIGLHGIGQICFQLRCPRKAHPLLPLPRPPWTMPRSPTGRR